MRLGSCFARCRVPNWSIMRIDQVSSCVRIGRWDWEEKEGCCSFWTAKTRHSILLPTPPHLSSPYSISRHADPLSLPLLARPGFLALAQLTPVILLSTKNNPLGLLLGLGYEKLNWAHRWSGRLLWLCATLHMAMWVDQYRRTGQLDVLTSSKNTYGIAAYALLCSLAVFSVRPARRRFYEVFYALQ